MTRYSPWQKSLTLRDDYLEAKSSAVKGLKLSDYQIKKLSSPKSPNFEGKKKSLTKKKIVVYSLLLLT